MRPLSIAETAVPAGGYIGSGLRWSPATVDSTQHPEAWDMTPPSSDPMWAPRVSGCEWVIAESEEEYQALLAHFGSWSGQVIDELVANSGGSSGTGSGLYTYLHDTVPGWMYESLASLDDEDPNNNVYYVDLWTPYNPDP